MCSFKASSNGLLNGFTKLQRMYLLFDTYSILKNKHKFEVLSTHNICFGREKRKLLFKYPNLEAGLLQTLDNVHVVPCAPLSSSILSVQDTIR